jgi:adenylate cyclase
MVKHTGDGIMAVFPRLADGLAGACEIQRQIAEYNDATAGAALAVRVGLASGNPIRRDDDYFGTVVQTAARLCAYAAPGEIALPETMSALPEAAGFTYDAPRPVSLKGFAAALPVRKLLWGG